MKYYYCKELANDVLDEIREKVKRHDKKPTLAILTIGHDPASEVYVRGKLNDASRCNIHTMHISFDDGIHPIRVDDEIKRLNKCKQISGIIVQQPMPFDKETSECIIERVSPFKDVDGLHADSAFTPCTALGVMKIIHEAIGDITGYNVLVIGRSKLAGEPIAKLALKNNATVTVAHSYTRHLDCMLPHYDVIISAAGIPNLVNLELCTNAKLVIDVGINHVDGKLCGDCYNMHDTGDGTLVTPVPGGVGLMTRAMLMKNVSDA